MCDFLIRYIVYHCLGALRTIIQEHPDTVLVSERANTLDFARNIFLSMKEIVEDDGLYATGTMVKVDHSERGDYLSVSGPIRLSDTSVKVARSPIAWRAHQ